jgi:hypothetical protein
MHNIATLTLIKRISRSHWQRLESWRTALELVFLGLKGLLLLAALIPLLADSVHLVGDGVESGGELLKILANSGSSSSSSSSSCIPSNGVEDRWLTATLVLLSPVVFFRCVTVLVHGGPVVDAGRRCAGTIGLENVSTAEVTRRVFLGLRFTVSHPSESAS